MIVSETRGTTRDAWTPSCGGTSVTSASSIRRAFGARGEWADRVQSSR